MTRRERDWGERGSKNKTEREKLVWKREEIRTHGKKGKDKKKKGGGLCVCEWQFDSLHPPTEAVSITTFHCLERQGSEGLCLCVSARVHWRGVTAVIVLRAQTETTDVRRSYQSLTLRRRQTRWKICTTIRLSA